MQITAALLVIVFLLTDASLHILWSTGSAWPARDQLSLIQGMLNSSKLQLLRPSVLLFLSTALLAGALALTFHLIVPEVHFWTGGILWIMFGAFLARFLYGFVYVAGIGVDKQSAFYRLNWQYYMPACFILSAAMGAVLFL